MDRFYAIVSKVCAWTLFVMTVLGALNAVLRYSSKFTGQVWSSNAFLEGQWYLFSAVFLLGAGYTLHKDKHVRVDVLYSRLSDAGQRRINLIGVVVFAIPFCLLGIWSSIEFVSKSIQTVRIHAVAVDHATHEVGKTVDHQNETDTPKIPQEAKQKQHLA